MPQSSIEQQALERVRRMYGASEPFKKPPVPQTQPLKEEHTRPPQADPRGSDEKLKEAEEQHPDMLRTLLKDNERSLLLLLLLILYSEKADPSVLFALMYLIL